MQIAAFVTDGCGELAWSIAATCLNPINPNGWATRIASPAPEVAEINGVTPFSERPPASAAASRAIIISSGIQKTAIVVDAAQGGRIVLDPSSRRSFLAKGS